MYQLVLLVGDDAVLLNGLRLFLEDAGHQVQTAMDMTRALGVLETSCPDAIVYDLRMQDVDGGEFYGKVRQNEDWRTIPFILLTATAEDVNFNAGFNRGSSCRLEKPFDPVDLLAVLNG